MRLNRVLSVLLVLLAAYALFSGSLALRRERVRAHLDAWHEAPDAAVLQDIQRARAQMADVLYWQPSHSDALLLAAKVEEWLALKDEPVQARMHWLAALQFYQQSLQSRPLWPETWAPLLILKWRLGLFDDELKRDMERAEHAGPNDPSIHLALVDVGLAGLRVPGFADEKWLQRIQHHLHAAAHTPYARDALPELLHRHQLQGWGCKELGTDLTPYLRKKICHPVMKSGP